MHSFTVHPGWRVLLTDLGLQPQHILRQAGLPDDLFGREQAALTTDEYFRLWRGVEAEADDPTLPLRFGATISVEAFDPPIFAALCSPNLNTALERIARYKRLIMPMILHIDVGEEATTLALEWLDATIDPPVSLVAVELIFFVQLSRIATRTQICPLVVGAPHPPEPQNEYTAYFGVAVQQEPRPLLVFRAADATKPFLTVNEPMWQYFEPILQQRLAELHPSATTVDRVRAALFELLPGGVVSIGAVATRLGTSARTLQRHLKNEGQSYQTVLDRTRESLAKHYLKTSRMTGAEIAYLLGFDDPNSFSRAFHSWTGETPEQARCAVRGIP